MCFAELALAGGFVAREPGQLGSLDVEERLVTLRARHLEPGVGFGERCLDFLRRLRLAMLRRFPSLARLLPVMGKERRMLAELPRRDLFDRARDCTVNVLCSLGSAIIV